MVSHARHRMHHPIIITEEMKTGNNKPQNLIITKIKIAKIKNIKNKYLNI